MSNAKPDQILEGRDVPIFLPEHRAVYCMQPMLHKMYSVVTADAGVSQLGPNKLYKVNGTLNSALIDPTVQIKENSLQCYRAFINKA